MLSYLFDCVLKEDVDPIPVVHQDTTDHRIGDLNLHDRGIVAGGVDIIQIPILGFLHAAFLSFLVLHKYSCST